MENPLDRVNSWFFNAPDFFRQYRWMVWGVFILLLVASAAGLPFLKFDVSMESFFGREDPVLMEYNRFKDSFGSDEGVYLVYSPRDGDVFSAQSLAHLKRLQEALIAASRAGKTTSENPLRRITRVDTLLNARYLEVKGDLLVSRDFIGDPPTDPQKLAGLKKDAMAHREYPLMYFSRDGRYGGIMIKTSFGTERVEETPLDPEKAFEDAGFEKRPEGEPDDAPSQYRSMDIVEYAKFMRAFFDVLEQPEFAEVFTFHPTGQPVLMGFFFDVLNKEIQNELTIVMILMFLVLWMIFRSLSAVVWPLVVVAASLVLTLGVASWSGTVMSMMVLLLVMLMLVVGVADSVHILSGYLFFRRKGQPHEEALRSMMRKTGLACFLTSLTTGLGMLSLLLAEIPPIRIFGVTAAIGVMVAFLVSVIMIPLMLDLWRPAKNLEGEKQAVDSGKNLVVQRFLSVLEPLSINRPWLMVLLFALVTAGLVVGVMRVRVDSNLVEIIRPGLPIRIDHEIADRHMGGTQNLEIFIRMGQAEALQDPEVLKAMETFQRYLEESHRDFVVKTTSLVQVAKNTFQVLNENRPEMYRIPADRPTLAQTLLLFENADPEERKTLVTEDFGAGRISVRLFNYGSLDYLIFFEDVQEKLTGIFSPLKARYPEMKVRLTGGLEMMMGMVQTLNRAQFQSFLFVLLVVTVLLFFVFGSFRVGVVAMIPNVFPALAAFGLMGFLGIPLDGDTLIIAPLLIGIAVDDTIHFITHYRADVVRTGDIDAAIVTSMREVGQAISYTSIILVLGFTILIISNHMGIANFGFLTAVAFFAALLADLVLLPALFKLMKVRFGAKPGPAPLPAESAGGS